MKFFIASICAIFFIGACSNYTKRSISSDQSSASLWAQEQASGDLSIIVKKPINFTRSNKVCNLNCRLPNENLKGCIKTHIPRKRVRSRVVRNKFVLQGKLNIAPHYIYNDWASYPTQNQPTWASYPYKKKCKIEFYSKRHSIVSFSFIGSNRRTFCPTPREFISCLEKGRIATPNGQVNSSEYFEIPREKIHKIKYKQEYQDQPQEISI